MTRKTLSKPLIILFTILNIAVNGFILMNTFLLTSKESDYYSSAWNLPPSLWMWTPTITMGLTFLAGIILFAWKRTAQAQILIACPLLLGMLFSTVPGTVWQTAAMKTIDEANRKHMECIVRFQEQHPEESPSSACPYGRVLLEIKNAGYLIQK